MFSKILFISLLKKFLKITAKITKNTEDIKKSKITNKNILLILYENLPTEFSDNFFLKNNVAIFFSKQNSINKIQHLNIKILIGHTNINKAKDEITTFFVAKTFSYKNIKIFEEKIVNTKSNSGVFLTPSEKDILLLLFERKKIEKNFKYCSPNSQKKNE